MRATVKSDEEARTEAAIMHDSVDVLKLDFSQVPTLASAPSPAPPLHGSSPVSPYALPPPSHLDFAPGTLGRSGRRQRARAGSVLEPRGASRRHTHRHRPRPAATAFLRRTATFTCFSAPLRRC